MADQDTAQIRQQNDADIIRLNPMEHVRKRPGMYVGGTDSKALHHLIYEVVDNSIDEALAGRCDHIFITLNRKRHLPLAVEYQKGWGGKDSRQYTLVAVQLDQPIDDGLFAPKKLAGWTMKSASGSEQSGPGRTQVPNTAGRDRTGSPTREG